MRWLSDFFADIVCNTCGDGELRVVHYHISNAWVTAGVKCLECGAADVCKIENSEFHAKFKALKNLDSAVGDAASSSGNGKKERNGI